MKIELNPIGIIHSPFDSVEGMPIQPKRAIGIKGSLEIFPEYAEGLKDLDGFSHIILVYHLHKIENIKLSVIPFLDTVERGVFATRSPSRPNSIGLSVVDLLAVEGNIVQIENIDALNQTPLLDIKPYIPEIDKPGNIRTGWCENVAR